MQNTLITMSRPGADHAVGMLYATVTGRADKWFFLSSPEMAVERALRADSCLIEPECGDTVLVCHGGTQSCFVLAVLARATPEQATLTLPGAVQLQTSQGQLQVKAEQLELQGRQRVTMVGAQVDVTGIRGELRFRELSASAEQAQARFGSLTSVAQNITSTVGRLVQKARDSFRWTENLEETRAGRVRMLVKDRFHMKAAHTTLLADGQVKIDGEKIDLGGRFQAKEQNMFAVTKQAGQCMAMPDVCNTPIPPAGPVPLPYPNIAMPMMGNPATTKVMISGMPALTKSSKITMSNGDQPGVNGGVVSGKIMGPAEFIMGSMKVKLEGNPAVRMGDTTKQNDGNAVGAVLVPSQVKVMIMS